MNTIRRGKGVETRRILSDAIVARAVEIRKTSSEQFHLQLTSSYDELLVKFSLSTRGKNHSDVWCELRNVSPRNI